MLHPLPAIFVYGTLKRGEIRQHCWPREPILVEPAAVRGRLYDLGSCPALTEGDDLVAGELWRFAPHDMPATLAALDEIEDCRQGPGDLYRRVIIQCQTRSGPAAAWTYLYNQPIPSREQARVPPGPDGLCRWSRPTASPDSAPQRRTPSPHP